MRKNPRPKQILLLEDDWVLKHTLDKILKKCGYGCIHPQKADEIFSHLNKGHILLIVADLHISWINTLDFCYMIKRSKQFNHIPFVFISGSTEESEIKKAFMRGCDDYLSKPFHISEILSTIETLLKINEYKHFI